MNYATTAELRQLITLIRSAVDHPTDYQPRRTRAMARARSSKQTVAKIQLGKRSHPPYTDCQTD